MCWWKKLPSRYVPANKLVKALVDIGILKASIRYERNRVFLFERYLELFGSENTS
jgi:hypothetical protein